jgi:hypothetical protein
MTCPWCVMGTHTNAACLAGAGPVQKPRVRGDVRNDFRASGLGHGPGDAFAKAVLAAPPLLLGEPAGCLDHEHVGVGAAEGERAVGEAHVLLEDVEDLLEQGGNVAAVSRGPGNAVQGPELQACAFDGVRQPRVVHGVTKL